MAVKRLLTGSSFGPDILTIISVAYAITRCELRLANDCDDAGALAKLLLEIASHETELEAVGLVAKAKAAWDDRNSNGG